MLSNSSLLHITVYTPINNNKKTVNGTERLGTTKYYICGNKFSSLKARQSYPGQKINFVLCHKFLFVRVSSEVRGRKLMRCNLITS